MSALKICYKFVPEHAVPNSSLSVVIVTINCRYQLSIIPVVKHRLGSSLIHIKKTLEHLHSTSKMCANRATRETHLSHTRGSGHNTSDTELLTHLRPQWRWETCCRHLTPSSQVALPMHKETRQKKTKVSCEQTNSVKACVPSEQKWHDGGYEKQGAAIFLRVKEVIREK